MIHFHFITLFPELITTWMSSSVLGRALEKGVFALSVYQLRDFTDDKHRTVDDTPYGGGGGMILKVEPLTKAVEAVWHKVGKENALTLYLSPGGHRLGPELLESIRTQSLLRNHLVLVCGHYEGVDQRFIDHWTDMEVSLGDFVLTGGELPAVALADALVRSLDGALGHPDASSVESFKIRAPGTTGTLLEYPQYTRPPEFNGLKVPSVLLSGDHQRVHDWRLNQAKEKTSRVRPDLLIPRTPSSGQR